MTASLALRDVPDDAVVLITGATDGIGQRAARTLLARGARVVLHGRSRERLDATSSELEKLSPGRIEGTLHADFADLASLRRETSRFLASGPRVDVLVNNAGVYMNERVVTVDGLESTMAVNHVAPFLLTHLLLRGCQSLGRIVNVASNAHRSGHLDARDVLAQGRRFRPLDAYGTSKLANILFTIDLAARVRPKGIAVNALHPGVISTKLLTEGFGMHGFQSVDDGADAIVQLTLGSADAVGTAGYFADGQRSVPAPNARDVELARALYQATASFLGVAPIEAP